MHPDLEKQIDRGRSLIRLMASERRLNCQMVINKDDKAALVALVHWLSGKSKEEGGE